MATPCYARRFHCSTEALQFCVCLCLCNPTSDSGGVLELQMCFRILTAVVGDLFSLLDYVTHRSKKSRFFNILNICNYEVSFGLIDEKMVTCKCYQSLENYRHQNNLFHCLFFFFLMRSLIWKIILGILGVIMQGVKFPFFSYFFLFFSAYPYFSYFLAISSYFSYFLAILHVMCISYISFQGFPFNFLFFLSGAHKLFLKIFQPHFLWNYLDFCFWSLVDWDGCRSAGRQVKIQKIYNLHQIINKYMNKVSIFCAKFLFFSCFLASRIPIFLFFSPFLLLDALVM